MCTPLLSLETFPNYKRLKPLICHYFGPDVNCQAPLHSLDNESKKKKEPVEKVCLTHRITAAL